MEEKKAIGIIGGTFDPIHIGHMTTAECALNQLGLEKVIFVPSAQPPHKLDRVISPVEKRYEMTLLATVDNPGFLVSDVEMKRPGSSYTIDTIKHFKESYPDYDIYFITGSDTIVEIHTWKSPEKLMGMTNFLTAKRPGYNYDDLESSFYEKYNDRIKFLDMPSIGISATEIRERVKADKTIKYQVHPSVEAYIKKYNLYK